MLEIGSVVDGKYKILNEIGHGGMSVVYLAINERANKAWAIKEVRKDTRVDFATVQQGLVAEVEILKKLNHPHLPSIIDVIDRDDSFLIVMDYVEGKNLESLLRHGGAQEPDRVIEWAKQLCDVLGYLHSRKPPIIYRDMKPSNVMLKPDGNVMLLDFGTAREYKDYSVADTTCLGTRGYAAPEQFGGRGQSDARTDIYSLGATIYHLLTGHSPADPPYEIKPLGYWNPAFSGTGLEKLVSKCTRQNPEERYQSCAELMYALEHVHDEDDAVQRRRSMIWGGFLASLAVVGAGVLGAVGFGLADLLVAGPLTGIFRTCLYVCLAIALVGALSALILYLRFDIRTIFEIRSGIAARRTIQRMAEANARTGRLYREDLFYASDRLTGSFSGPLSGQETAPPPQYPTQPAAAAATAGDGGTELLSPAGDGGTELLAPAGNGNTTILSASDSSKAAPAVAETTILRSAAQRKPGFVFQVTQSVLLIHTDETI